ncbi:MAG TPA: DHHA1 domain-containing protein, partial [Vicinamibacterales bacterium]|nr:DHHA1 domain-containing protein [Vicinamibacterales bacterium]
DATVASRDTRDAGAGTILVTLDQTAFYPTSGGQPFDTGTLGGFRVVDVVDQDDGTIGHVLDLQLRTQNSQSEAGTIHPEPGARVAGEIDWNRRFDHMQQHTGQHVLSAAFDRLFNVATVSFHLGAESATIDLARPVAASQIAAAEDEANRIVWEDRPVRVRYATAEEASALKLRKPPAREGTLRLIDVEDFDLSACGGTHVARTGAIGVIATASSEKFKGGHRVEFVCGGRALARFRSLRDAVAASVRMLSVMPGELPITIERMQADAKDQKRAMAAMQGDLAKYRADELAAAAEAIGPIKLVARVVEGDASVLKTLASTIAERRSHIAVFASTSRPSLVVIARASDVELHAQQLLASLILRFGGRGGGKSDLAQGGLNGAADQIIAAARVSITAQHATSS